MVQLMGCGSVLRIARKLFPNRIIKPRVEPGDIWDASELGVFPHKHSKRGNKLNFSFIQQEWLKENVKKFIKYRSSNIGFDGLRQR